MENKENDMLALALGRLILEYDKALNKKSLVEHIKCSAEQCLLDISAILDRSALSDFECIEEIIVRMEKEGLGTWRHDFS